MADTLHIDLHAATPADTTAQAAAAGGTEEETSQNPLARQPQATGTDTASQPLHTLIPLASNTPLPHSAPDTASHGALHSTPNTSLTDYYNPHDTTSQAAWTAAQATDTAATDTSDAQPLSAAFYATIPTDTDGTNDAMFHLRQHTAPLPGDTAHALAEASPPRGSEGNLPPYNPGGDNAITAIIIACLLLTVTCLSRSRRFMARQAKSFFHTPHGKTTAITETGNEMAAQLLLSAQTCLLLALLTFTSLKGSPALTLNTPSPYTLLWALSATLMAYLAAKAALYTMVNAVFFDGKGNGQWMKAFLFITAAEGVALLPAPLMQAYFGATTENTTIFTLSVIVLAKLSTFFRLHSLFFKRAGGFLLLILYFCALEIAPPMFLWGIMEKIISGMSICA